MMYIFSYITISLQKSSYTAIYIIVVLLIVLLHIIAFYNKTMNS